MYMISELATSDSRITAGIGSMRKHLPVYIILLQCNACAKLTYCLTCASARASVAVRDTPLCRLYKLINTGLSVTTTPIPHGAVVSQA